MTIYFLTEEGKQNPETMHVKIGYSNDVKRRIADLQTGNPDRLALMGEVRTADRDADRALERRFHAHYAASRLGRGEWFCLEADDVIDALKSQSMDAYITVGDTPFEIISYDRKGVPEIASPWEWGDVETYEFCPVCGWAGGWSYNENYGGERCLSCGSSEHQYSDACQYVQE